MQIDQVENESEYMTDHSCFLAFITVQNQIFGIRFSL